tara:strand:+ start:301 stop:1155 length:855 start_codon:yes stop_codon:yes gene_type:complete
MISIVIIIDKVRPALNRLFNSLKDQLKEYETEVLLIHESETKVTLPNFDIDIKYHNIKPKQGFSYNRNKGLEFAKGEIIVFIDDDIWVHKDWLKNLVSPILNDSLIYAVTSGTVIPKSNLIGDSISALGFPGGGSLGFENVWKVDGDGFTDHICVGNCALRRKIFDIVGKFDESMKSGAEDAEFSFRMDQKGIKIKYVKEAYAFHEARDKFIPFIKWQLRRGRANFQFKKRVGNVKGFIKLRMWSAFNILKVNKYNWRLPFIILFLGLSFMLQQIGFFLEKFNF